MRRFHNIIFISDYESFLCVLKAIHEKSFYINGFFLFVIVTKYENQYSDMQKMSNDLWQNFIINANILAYGKESKEIKMFTYHPFQPGNCTKVSLIMINKFVNHSFINEEVYFEHTKLDNLHKCPLKVVTFSVPPLMILKKDDVNNQIILRGIEGELLNRKFQV
jgi:hypothetical protein